MERPLKKEIVAASLTIYIEKLLVLTLFPKAALWIQMKKLGSLKRKKYNFLLIIYDSTNINLERAISFCLFQILLFHARIFKQSGAFKTQTVIFLLLVLGCARIWTLSYWSYKIRLRWQLGKLFKVI